MSTQQMPYAGGPPQPGERRPSNTPATAGLAVGIVAFIFGWVPVFGLILGLGAVALGVIAVRKAPVLGGAGKGMAITDIVLGAVAALTSLLLTLIGVAGAIGGVDTASAPGTSPSASVTSSRPTPSSTSPSPSATTASPQPSTSAPAPAPTTPAPAPSRPAPASSSAVPAPASPAAPNASQTQAVRKATSYLSYTAFSQSGLAKQLEFEGFSPEDAAYGAANAGADWNAQAVKKAKSYLDYTSFSHSGLVNQLEFEGFTPEQAEIGATGAGL